MRFVKEIPLGKSCRCLNCMINHVSGSLTDIWISAKMWKTHTCTESLCISLYICRKIWNAFNVFRGKFFSGDNLGLYRTFPHTHTFPGKNNLFSAYIRHYNTPIISGFSYCMSYYIKHRCRTDFRFLSVVCRKQYTIYLRIRLIPSSDKEIGESPVTIANTAT
jgi:hypothetical protein